MPAIPHRLDAAGGTDISYWHPMEGEITQTQLQGTVPQTHYGPPETQSQQAQHGDPQKNIQSTPDIVHTVEEPGAVAQAGAIPAQQQGPACSIMVWDATPQEEAGASPPQGDKQQLAQQHNHSYALATKNPEGPWHRSSTTKPYCSRVTSCS